MEPLTPAPPRPKLKLSVSSMRVNSSAEPGAATPSATPSATPLTTPKIRINVPSKSLPPTPADVSTPASATTKAGRLTKPTAKVVEASKRQHEEVEADAE